MRGNINVVALMILATFGATIVTVFAASSPVPIDKLQLNNWFYKNVGPFSIRKAQLDPVLVKAEESAIVLKVRKDGSGNFKTINDAIRSIPIGNTKRTMIWIGGGVYNEKIKIVREKPFITLYGSPDNMPTLTFNDDANKKGTLESATLNVESNYFTAANLIIVNSSPRPDGKRLGAQAVAAKLSGDKSVLYNCKLIGFQDTLCDDTGLHVFKDCYIEGTVDFIFGRGTSLYLNTHLNVVEKAGVAYITAHAREVELDPSVYSFVHCTITGNGVKNTYLGRSWRPRSRVIFSYTKMNDIVHPEGWNDKSHPEYQSTVLFGEYKNSGPGAVGSGRVKFSKQMSQQQVNPFLSLEFVKSSSWLLPPPNPKA